MVSAHQSEFFRGLRTAMENVLFSDFRAARRDRAGRNNGRQIERR